MPPVGEAEHAGIVDEAQPQWLSFRGLRPQLWPVTLDLVEWNRARFPSPALHALAEVIAPQFEQVDWPKHTLGIASDDIGADLDSDRIESFLRAQIVRLLSGCQRLPPDAGRAAHLLPTDGYVLRRIRRVQQRPAAAASDYSSSILPARQAEKAARTVPWRAADAITRFVGASSQGIPGACLDALRVGDPRDGALIEAFTGPDGNVWWRLGAHVKLSATARDRENVASTRRALFDCWPPNGWGYIRRLFLLVLSRPSADDLARHYQEALYGFSTLWRTESLWQYLAALVRRGLRDEAECGVRVNWIATAVALGRIAPDLDRELATIRLLTLTERRWGLSALERARIQYERGNMHARLRKPEHLAAADACLNTASAELNKGGTGAQGEQMRAQIANTRALVAYHSHRNDDALQLELLADRIARATSEGAMREWADVTLAMNRARLIERRFGDSDGALRLLSGLTNHSDRNVSARACVSVARLLLQRENWTDLIAVIDAALGGVSSSMLLEEEELLLLLMQATAFAKTGEKQQALRNCRQLESKNRFLGSAVIGNLIIGLKQSLAAAV